MTSGNKIINKKAMIKRLQYNEWIDFEVKEAKNEVPKDVWKSVSTFSNTEGGNIVFGVKDHGEGNFEFTGVSSIEKLQNDFISGLRGEKFNIKLSSKAHIFDFDGKKVLLFHINSMPRNCKPIYFGGDIRNIYIRRGSGDYKCSCEEVNRMLREASEFSSDSMILEGYGIKDIDSKSVSEYKNLLELKLPESLFHKLKTMEEIITNEATAPRNPLIAKLFRMIGLAETAGSGMVKIFNAWKQLNYKTPLIDNNTANYYFKMTFPLEKETATANHKIKNIKKVNGVGEKVGEKLSENQQKIIDAITDKPEITAKELAEIVGIIFLNMRLEKETLWLNLNKISELFEYDKHERNLH